MYYKIFYEYFIQEIQEDLDFSHYEKFLFL